MKELIVISGKGGTGKTSIVASFAALSQSVLADCDVDAADLHLVLSPDKISSHTFSGGKRAEINAEKCTACGTCAELCRFEAIAKTDPATAGAALYFRVDPVSCEGCGVCAWFCPEKAIHFGPVVNGEWYISTTRHGPMVHAKLHIAEENSGKLVSLIRKQARQAAEEKNIPLVLVDGSPGIGCPVISSITGADMVLIVTEPTLSGLHDLDRVADLAAHFSIPALVCINKWDINPDMSDHIARRAEERDLQVAGRVRYDTMVTDAQIHKLSVVEYGDSGSARDIRAVWRQVETELNRPR